MEDGGGGIAGHGGSLHRLSLTTIRHPTTPTAQTENGSEPITRRLWRGGGGAGGCGG